jgi:ABC-type phosphate transport system substrate-binding protein
MPSQSPVPSQSPAPSQNPDQGVVLIVNSANPISALYRNEVEGLFLGKVYRWPGTGRDVLPVDQTDNSPARETFARDILKRSPEAIKAYWEQQIFSGHSTPPPVRVSDTDVLSYVRTNPGAIGYVQAGTDLGDGVKAIWVSP